MRRRLAPVLFALWLSAPAHAATGRLGMVAAEHRLAAEAGIAILRQGGNAVDAAVASALAVGVVNPSSCGIGGGGFMLVHEQRSGKVHALDYRETAPTTATRDMFVRDGRAVPDASRYGGLAVAVPGEVAGLDAVLRRFGTLPWAAVAAPAITYAREGFRVEAHLAHAIAQQAERIRREPALATLLLRADGTPLQVGDTLRQSNLARTLITIGADGPRGFYSGATADAIVRSVTAAGGRVSHADLATYRPAWRRPLQGTFHGADVYGMPPPSSGGGVLIEALNIIAGDDLDGLGRTGPSYLHLLAEAMQFGFAARATFYGDSDFIAVPLRRLLHPAFAARLRQRISAATTFSPAYYGAAVARDDSGTSHMSIIDRHGNAVACTTSINTAFGSMVVAEDTGIILNNTMDDFSAQPGTPNIYGLVGTEANAIAPRKRALSSMTPTIVIEDGVVTAAAGGSGGPFIISATMQTVLNTLVFGLDATAAVAAPRVHHQWMPPALMVEPGMPPAVRSVLRRLGHRLVDVAEIGAVQLVRRSPDGLLDGAADPRKGGEAIGW